MVRYIFSKFKVIKQRKEVRNFLQNYTLNISLIAFPWTLYQICEHSYNNFLGSMEIRLHTNVIGFTKKFPFVASPCIEASHATEKVPWLAT